MNHNEVLLYDDFLEPITTFLKRHNLLVSDNSEMMMSIDNFQTPEYLLTGNLSNMDKFSEFIRKVLKI